MPTPNPARQIVDPARVPVAVRGVRRARARVRRYCAANRPNRLGTLTFGPPFCTDPVELRCHVAMFFRNLRAGLGVSSLPYVRVPELHADGRRFHVHFAVGRYIKQSLIEQAWGHGFVSIKRLSDLPVGSTSWHEARKAAGYLSKYDSKTFDTNLDGRHRYEVGQGFQPAVTRLAGDRAESVLAQACELMRAHPETRWVSWEVGDWQGPPAVWFAWA